MMNQTEQGGLRRETSDVFPSVQQAVADLSRRTQGQIHPKLYTPEELRKLQKTQSEELKLASQRAHALLQKPICSANLRKLEHLTREQAQKSHNWKDGRNLYFRDCISIEKRQDYCQNIGQKNDTIDAIRVAEHVERFSVQSVVSLVKEARVTQKHVATEGNKVDENKNISKEKSQCIIKEENELLRAQVEELIKHQEGILMETQNLRKELDNVSLLMKAHYRSIPGGHWFRKCSENRDELEIWGEFV